MLSQVKLSSPGGKSGIRIPLAFKDRYGRGASVFNKPDYRANVGIAFDLDTLLGQGELSGNGGCFPRATKPAATLRGATTEKQKKIEQR